MNLVHIGFVTLTLLALADGYLLTLEGGFGGISGIFGILLLLTFIAALGKRNNITPCPADYMLTPNDPTSCIRFFSSPTKTFNDADTACVNDGGMLLKLSTASFPIIQQLARNISGVCDYWVQAIEAADGSWEDINEVPIPSTPGLFFLTPTNANIAECGLMGNNINFYLLGAGCTEMHCYICQKNI
ncbi:hypothetical protein ACJMK2_004134 [Sinanodonta woodiana]|uniref:C-type lectin domain-containing protein n=1 Tax=Sinanodonta woodiana TaxID=1069815 RepID=A0ABD3Y2U4_SINWO